MKTKYMIGWLVAVVLVFGVLGCTGSGNVNGIQYDKYNIQRGESINFMVTGTGNCTSLQIKWGDGTFLDANNVDFDSHPAGLKYTHTYDGWGGTKTVSAQGVTNCGGKVQTSIVVEPTVFTLAYYGAAAGINPSFNEGVAYSANTCELVPNAPAVRRNSIVHITSRPDIKKNFGCWFNGCIYNADGEPNSKAPSNYPFPGLRKYSLVVRLGSQVVQGSTDFTFTASQYASMEVCENDEDVSDNTGVWGINIEVNESNA